MGRLPFTEFERVAAAPMLHLPMPSLTWRFDSALAVPFGVAALAACLRAMGDVTTCQKMNDADWTRPSLRSLSGGTLANGISTTLSGTLGSIGVNTLTSSVGLSGATGVTSRVIAYGVGMMFVVVAFLPKAAALFAIMPRPVLGATLLFSSAFVFVNGLQIVTSRMLDIRRTLVIGLAFMIGLAVDLYPAFFATIPAELRPFTGSSLVLGTITALVLNLAFRAGTRRTERLVIEPGQLDAEKLHDFMTARGSAWGARRDVVERASFNVSQSVETILDAGEPTGPLEIDARFDEFNLDVRISYTGPPLDLPERRPTNEEIMASEEGQRRLAGFLLRRHADRVQSTSRGGRTTILFHFDH
jgi:xanthine permease XanP